MITPEQREATRARRRADQAARRVRAIAAGVCVTCCHRPAVTGKTRCVECAEYGRTRKVKTERHYNHTQHASAVDRFCIDCQAHGLHRDGCPEATRAA